MKTLFIVARESMVDELEEFFQKNGVSAYTVLSNVKGKGETGRVQGTLDAPYINSIIFAVLPSDQADRVVSALKALHAGRAKARHGEPIPLKVFSHLCEEHI